MSETVTQRYRERLGVVRPAPRPVVAGCLATVLVVAIAIWVLSPRFDITFPSIIDDWSSLENAPTALSHLVHLNYSPAEVGDAKRFRPAFTAIWNSLEWHTFGAPGDMTATNVWNVLRLVLFNGALVWLVMLGVPPERRRSWLLPLLAIATPLAIAMNFAIEFARLGPGEPNMFGGMVVGAMLMGLGLRHWLRGGRAAAVAVPLAAGFLLWVFGVFQKEASVCALLAIPFLYFHLDRRWRGDGTISAPLWRARPFQVVGALTCLPLLGILVAIKTVVSGGSTVYGAKVPHGINGWISRVHDSFMSQWHMMDPLLAHPYGRALALAATVAVAGTWLWRRRVPWLEIGLTVTAWSLIAFQGLGQTYAARYYLPTIALFGAVLAISLAQAPSAIRVVAIVAAAWFVIPYATIAHNGVAGWSQNEIAAGDSIGQVAKLNPWRCPVYMGNLEEEPASAIASVVHLAPHDLSTPCDRRFKALLIVGRQTAGPAQTNEAIYDTCAKHPGWIPVKETPLLTFFGCTKWAHHKKLYGQFPSHIKGEDRLVPGVRHSDLVKKYPRIGAPKVVY